MMITSKRIMSWICCIALLISVIPSRNNVYGAYVTNLTWNNYPTGWQQDNDGILGSGSTLAFKANEQGSNFSYEANITLLGSGAQASQGGLVTRASGTSYFNSYVIMMHKTSQFQRIEIHKFSGNAAGTILGVVDKPMSWNQPYNLRVTTKGNQIKVYFNNEDTPCLDVNDSAYINGQFGLLRAGTNVRFNDITQTPDMSTDLPSPVSHWTFEDSLDDQVGSYNGTAGSPIYTTKDYMEGTKGLYLDGVDDTVNLGNVPVGNNFTLSFWVKPSDIHRNWTPILSKFAPNANTFWLGLHDTDGKIRFGIYKNGKTELPLDTDLGALIDNRWSHVTCTYDGHYQRIYIDGVLAKQSNNHNYTLAPTGANLEIAKQLDLGGGHLQAPYKGTIDDLRYYNTALPSDQILQLFNSFQRKKQDISLIIDQVGFRLTDKKMAVLRSINQTPNWNPENANYEVKRKSDHVVVKTGSIDYWGEKWDSYWWIADFSDYLTEGDYYVQLEGPELPILKSNYFKIEEDLLMSEDIIQSQLDNLKSRIVNVGELQTGIPGTPIQTGIVWRRAVGTLNPNTYALSTDIHIYRDCGGSNMTELESATITMNALIDILEYHDAILTTEQRNEIKDLIKLSANYLVDVQQISSDPTTNGRMHHMGMGWSEQEIRTYSWRDMPHAIVGLARAYKTVGDEYPSLSSEWIEAAKRAYDCMTFRPYYLYSELNGPVGFTNPSWNYGALMSDLRVFYDKPSSWSMPMTNTIQDLRTRDIMPAIWACTMLYSIDPQDKYLNQAETFTDIVADRQFVDYSNPIEGTYGNFYEFANDSETFVTEMHQWSKWNMGNYDPLRLKGIMELYNYRPDSQNAAKWHNVIKTYGEQYVLKQKDLTPFGITPLTMSRSRGISFFRSLNHGANSIYGLAAINMLELGEFLNDSRYQDIAGRNVNYITGMNPGWPNKRNEAATDWGAFSWAYGIGESSFGGNAHLPPKGSVTNGFTSNTQFSLDSMNIADGPNGIYNPGGGLYFHEDGVMHSISFLNGAIRIEADYDLVVNTRNQSVPVSADIRVELDGQVYNYQSGANGTYKITDLPLGKTGMLYVTYNGKELSKKIDTISSGKMLWQVDFADYIEVSISTPETINKNTTSNCVVTITNHGQVATTANIKLSAHGVILGDDTIQKTLNPNETATQTISIQAGDTSVPYMISSHGTTTYNTFMVSETGKVN